MSPAEPLAPRSERATWLIAAALFCATLALFTRHNQFSFNYHPDEDGKVHQIIERERNFHHPLLMLNAADLAVHIARVPLTNQAVVIAGRWVSAAFAAGAVALLSLLVSRRAGPLAGLGTGLLVGAHAELYKAAHFFKEDTALVFGLALFFVAADAFCRRPDVRSLRFLGIAAAVATSGKYVGLLAFLFALPLVWRMPRASLAQPRWKPFLLAFGATFLLLNIPPTTHPSSPFRSLKREVVGVTAGHRGLTREVPHAKYFTELRDNVPAVLLGAASIYLLTLIATARRRTGAEWALTLFPIVFFTMLSFSPKTGGRYLLPVTTLFCAFAALAIVEIGRLPGRWKILMSASGLFFFPQAHLLTDTIYDFKQDDRVELAAWIHEHVPAEAFLVEDHRVNLAALETPIPQRVFDADYAADLSGSLDEMRMWGTVYVAVSQRAYDRFFSDLKPRAAEKADFDRRKEFYTRLFAEAELVWERRARGIVYLQPGLRLYRLPPRG